MDDPQISHTSSSYPSHADYAEDNEMADNYDDVLNIQYDQTPIPIIENPDNYTTRELRPQRREVPYMTWVDNDRTGDYDPSEPRTIRRSRNKTSKGDGPKERHPIETPKLITTLAFKSPEKRHSFTEVCAKTLTHDVANPPRYRFRPRMQEDDEDADNDITAKPYARGCKGCVKLAGDPESSECSLIHDERNWPCNACAEIDTDCELVIAPVRKRACESCRQRKIPCSYDFTRNHIKACTQCDTESRTCIAGPVVQHIRQRLRYDRDWKSDPLPPITKGKARAPGECFECKQADLPCHYDPERDAAPCEACVRNGARCTFGECPPPKTMASRRRKRKRACESSIETQGESGEEHRAEHVQEIANLEEEARRGELGASHDAEGIAQTASADVDVDGDPHCNHNTMPSLPIPPQGRPATRTKTTCIARRIRTAFCHPIIFNCDEQRATRCDFCEDPLLRIRGLGRITATVIDGDDGDIAQYIEIGGGHSEHGYRSTQVCCDCTTELISIMFCPGHEMERIPGPRYTREQRKAAMRELVRERYVRPVHEYCALCCNLAQYECRKCDDGSGLRLCTGCAVTLTHEYLGDLQDMLDDIDHKPVEGAPLGLRADAELLDRKETGALARFFASQITS